MKQRPRKNQLQSRSFKTTTFAARYLDVSTSGNQSAHRRRVTRARFFLRYRGCGENLALRWLPLRLIEVFQFASRICGKSEESRNFRARTFRAIWVSENRHVMGFSRVSGVPAWCGHHLFRPARIFPDKPEPYRAAGYDYPKCAPANFGTFLMPKSKETNSLRQPP